MKVLLFSHKNDIDGMGSVVLSKLAFDSVDYVLCGTFNLTENVLKYYNNGNIYDYDMIFVTDLCLEDPILSIIAADDKLCGKILNLDHHKTYLNEKYTKYAFINVKVSNEFGLCCGTSLFYEYLVKKGVLDENNLAIKEFVELTRQHDTWEWKNIYNNENARKLATLFDILGTSAYINSMVDKLVNYNNKFEFEEYEDNLINNRLNLVYDKLKFYSDKVIYRDILGLKAGIVFITYEYRNELAEYFRENNFDMDFVMMIAMDPGVICYRSVRDGVNVRQVAEYFSGKGHDRAGSNPINDDVKNNLIKILVKK